LGLILIDTKGHGSTLGRNNWSPKHRWQWKLFCCANALGNKLPQIISISICGVWFSKPFYTWKVRCE